MTDSRARIVIGVLSTALVLAVGAVVVLLAADGDDADVATGTTTTTAPTGSSTATSSTTVPTTGGPETSDPETSDPETSDPATVQNVDRVVIADGYVLGYWDGTAWVSLAREDGSPLPPPHVSAGDRFRFVDAAGSDLGRSLPVVGEGCYLSTSHGIDDPMVEGMVGIPEGTGELLPRPVRVDRPLPDHVDAVAAWLRAEDVADPEVLIDRVLRVDLDGDGDDEVFIEASRYADGGFTEEAGGYSVVLYRFVDERGEVQTVVVAGDSVTEEDLDTEFAIVFVHRILAVADLSGDGRLELVTRSSYYEGESVDVQTIRDARIDVVLSAGCGA